MDLFFKLTGPVIAIVLLFLGFFEKDSNDPNQSPRIGKLKWLIRVVTIVGLIVACVAVLWDRSQSQEKERKSQEESRAQQAALAAYQSKSEENQKEAIAQAKELKQAQADLIAAQKQNLELSATLLDVQTRGLHQLTRIGLDRMLTGIEISYKPTAQEWKGIVDLYRTLVPTNGEKSYYDSPIIATRAGAFWRIDFAEISMTEGRKWFPPVFTDDVRNRGFEQILQRASLPLWITWGTGAQTFLEPMRGDYPSEIRLSPELFSFTLRPPLLELNLDSLHANSLITLRSRRRWSDLTFHSLDPAVKLDQTLHLKCDRAKMAQDVHLISIKERLHAFTCGSHSLQMTFKTLSR